MVVGPEFATRIGLDGRGRGSIGESGILARGTLTAIGFGGAGTILVTESGILARGTLAAIVLVVGGFITVVESGNLARWTRIIGDLDGRGAIIESGIGAMDTSAASA